jgi:hypothetical protein
VPTSAVAPLSFVTIHEYIHMSPGGVKIQGKFQVLGQGDETLKN